MTTASDVPATPRTPRAITRPRAETAGKLDRRDALAAMFHALDVNGDGRVSLDEATRAACGVCPTMTESEVDEWFRSMDVSDTGLLDESEYVAGMLNVTRGMTEAEFATSARDTIARTARKVKHPRYYFHRDDARGYLGEELVPLLERGLDALLREVETERLRVASGADWDEDGYVPDDWRPTRPLRFLGKLAPAPMYPRGRPWRAGAEAAAAEAKRLLECEMAARGGKPRPMHELSREEKLEMCFDAMDRNGDGTLTFDEMLRVCRKIDPGRGREEAASMVQWMDVDSDGKVSKAEYETAMLAVMEHLDDEVFDLGIERTLTATRFADASRAEKLRMVFEKCDADADGRLDIDELRSLANALIVGGDEQKVRRTMKWLDANGDDVVTFEEFVTPMLAATAPVDDDPISTRRVRRILAADGDATEPDAADALHAKLAAYVASMETHATTRQVSVYDLDVLLKDKTKKVGVLDCRPAHERAVSGLDVASRGSVAARTSVAVALGDVAFVDAVDNNLAALIESASELETLEHCDVVVCVSAFGAEAGAAAPLVAEKTRVADCRNLCGGIVAWFNAGFALSDPSTGAACEAVPPARKRAHLEARGATRSSSRRRGRRGGGTRRRPADCRKLDSSVTTVDFEKNLRRPCTRPHADVYGESSPPVLRARRARVRVRSRWRPFSRRARWSSCPFPTRSARAPRRARRAALREEEARPEAAILAHEAEGDRKVQANSRRDRGRDRGPRGR